MFFNFGAYETPKRLVEVAPNRWQGQSPPEFQIYRGGVLEKCGGETCDVKGSRKLVTGLVGSGLMLHVMFLMHVPF